MRSPAFDVDWVFGYGSLIWNPEIEFEQAALARLHGWHRSFCVSSTRYRGTADEPGVVLGLDRGGSCVGIAYRLRDESREDAIRHLYEREIPDWETRVYRALVAEVRLGDGSSVRALTFAADRARPSYARLSDDEIVRRLQLCCGRRGANLEYALNTWRALEAHGVRDARLGRLVRRLLRDADASPSPAPNASLIVEAAS
jgi:cation transport protein ChaC